METNAITGEIIDAAVKIHTVLGLGFLNRCIRKCCSMNL